MILFLQRMLCRLAVCVTLSVVTTSALAQNWSILEYDKDGKVTGVKEGTQDSDTTDGLGEENRRAIEPGEILVVDPTDKDLATLESAGFKLLRKNTLSGLEFILVQLKVPDGMSVPDALDYLTRQFPKLTVGTNDLMDLSGGPGVQVAQAVDYSRNLSGWGVVPETCGKGLVLGQIDGFVHENHPALRGKNLVYKSFLKSDRVPAAENHGTAVAVLLIGRKLPNYPGGLLPAAKLYAANIFERRNGKDVGNLAAMIRAIDWLVTNGVHVANLSIAGQDNVIMRLAVKRSLEKGILIVAAAGNNGAGAPPAWPAAHPDTFSVTAIDDSMHLYQFANQGKYIDFAAPGVNIPTDTPNGIMSQSGTSFAAPFITAMVALHLKAGFRIDPDLIRRSMQRYTTDLGLVGKDDLVGWGLVRLRPAC
ncbi:MAG: S8 family serine peptidase [Alphaproteobacteria bacterium]|nr:S8 family serine peptidase [Alphaproteobacteria bacterium]